MVTEEELKNMSPEEIKELQKQNCIFCKIGSKEIPAKVLYEDDICIAFLDIAPLAFGHTILAPKEHFVFFSQVPDNITSHMFKVSKQISQSMLKALQVKGTNIYIANGEYAGQMAPHFIIHILPRKEDDAIEYFHPQKNKTPPDYLSKVQETLIARIDETFNTDMKNKILGKEKTSETKNQEKTNSNSDNSNNQSANQSKNEVENADKEMDKLIGEKEKEEKKNKGKMDLDKIANLFK